MEEPEPTTSFEVGLPLEVTGVVVVVVGPAEAATVPEVVNV